MIIIQKKIHSFEDHKKVRRIWVERAKCASLVGGVKLYIPSTLNIDQQLIVCAENVKSWFKSWVLPFTFQAYILHHTLNCMCVSLFKFHIWILEQFFCCPKRPALPRHIKVWVSFELFGILVAFCSFFLCSLTVFHRGRQQKKGGRQQKSSRADKQHCFP